MKNILFFLSAQEIDKKYSEPVLELVRQIVKSGYSFVYGGTELGLMKQAAAEVAKLNGRIIAISSAEFAHRVNKKAHKIQVAKTVAERIEMLFDESDAIIALPGGSGTLDEISAIIDWKKRDLHKKPIILFNTERFWNGLIEQYKHMRKEGFLPKEVESLFYVSDDPNAVISHMNKSLA